MFKLNNLTPQQEKILGSKAINDWLDEMGRTVKLIIPTLTEHDIKFALSQSALKRYKEEALTLKNNYKNKEVASTVLDIIEYIDKRKPIATSWGVLWSRHEEVPNPLLKMIEGFMNDRDLLKGEMFKYPKGSQDFQYYDLLQLLAKIDANGLYGALGMCTCLFFNLYVAASTTTQGRTMISAVGMFFEGILANNVKFGSLEEVFTFINNIRKDIEFDIFKDEELGLRNISINECFVKIAMTIGFQWVPDEEDLELIYKALHSLPQVVLNRLYYKNNLYEFTDNVFITNLITSMMSKLRFPFLNPYSAPEEIKEDLELFTNLLRQYVYYSHQIIDGIDRMDNMIKSVTLLSDTDSAICSFDAWYNYSKGLLDDPYSLEVAKVKTLLCERVKDDPIYDEDFEEFTLDEKLKSRFVHLLCRREEPDYDFDFFNEEIIEIERSIDPTEVIPQDNVKYSLINILAYALGKLVNEYMIEYTKIAGSYDPNKKCLIISKNEFLIKSALLTMNKKNYAFVPILQEGRKIEPKLEIKGLPIDKSSMNATTREALKKLMFEDILNIDPIDQLVIIKKLAILKQRIYQSLESGDKTYYKPQTVKSIGAYDDPFRIPGIKASMAWNELRGGLEAIDLDSRNSVDLLKVDIDSHNINQIRDTNPEVYQSLLSIVGAPKEKPQTRLQEIFKKKITTIAIPKDVESIPRWLIHFIDYETIIQDNLKNFPIESIGIERVGRDKVVNSNILKL